MVWVNLAMKQEQTHSCREQTCGCQGVRMWEKEGLGSWDYQMQTIIYIGWVDNKVLLYITGNYIKYPVIGYNGNKYEKRIYICITESLLLYNICQ